MDEPNLEGLREKRCLVTGADGFLGRALCKAAIRHGALVSGFGRRSADSPLNIDWHAGAFSEEAALAAALENQDVVFHLLGSSTPASALNASGSVLNDDVKSTFGMLDLLRDRPKVMVVFASSGGTIYGISGNDAIREDHSLVPIAAYGANKLMVEQYMRIHRREYGRHYCSLRIANAYGPGQTSTRGQGFVAAAIRATLKGRVLEVWGDGSAVRDYVYVDDVAQAFLSAALYDGELSTFNVGSGCGRSLNEVLDDVAVALGRRCEVVYRPGRTIDVPWNVLNIGLIRGEMGWRPMTDWRYGLGRTSDWLRAALAG